MANNSPLTWKQIGIIIMILTFAFALAGYVNTKADKVVVDKQFEQVEQRTKEQRAIIQESFKENIKKIEENQSKLEEKIDKIYTILLRIKNDGNKTD